MDNTRTQAFKQGEEKRSYFPQKGSSRLEENNHAGWTIVNMNGRVRGKRSFKGGGGLTQSILKPYGRALPGGGKKISGGESHHAKSCLPAPRGRRLGGRLTSRPRRKKHKGFGGAPMFRGGRRKPVQGGKRSPGLAPPRGRKKVPERQKKWSVKRTERVTGTAAGSGHQKRKRFVYLPVRRPKKKPRAFLPSNIFVMSRK